MPSNVSKTDGTRGRLIHAASSYYSMIARLAIAEAGIACEFSTLDIHARMDQFEPAYAKLNRNMTVPTLVLPDRVLDQSRDIMEWALAQIGMESNAESRQWVDRHYAFPIEQLTFGWLLSWNHLARWLVPSRLSSARNRLETLAKTNPDLAATYRARAEVFAERVNVFNIATVRELFHTRRRDALALLDDLGRALSDDRPVLVPPHYGCADVVFTTFLARMEFVGMRREITKRPALARYYGAMRQRPNFAAADMWTRLQPLRMLREMMRAHANADGAKASAPAKAA
jgi:ganglioside-induced differentiation-associated protein 1